VGGLPQEPPPPQVVRIGGKIVAPKLVRSVTPVYPQLGVNAHISTIVILEAQVDTHGFVKTVRVLRGNPLFDEPAVEAVKQWRYQPLLLNGQPTEFILTVTVNFSLKPQDLQ
jgi:protein TonB